MKSQKLGWFRSEEGWRVFIGIGKARWEQRVVEAHGYESWMSPQCGPLSQHTKIHWKPLSHYSHCVLLLSSTSIQQTYAFFLFFFQLHPFLYAYLVPTYPLTTYFHNLLLPFFLILLSSFMPKNLSVISTTFLILRFNWRVLPLFECMEQLFTNNIYYQSYGFKHWVVMFNILGEQEFVLIIMIIIVLCFIINGDIIIWT